MSPRIHRRPLSTRARLGVAGTALGAAGTAVAAAAVLGLGVTTNASAADIPVKQEQMNLAGLGYLPYSGVDGNEGPATRAAAKEFQADQCLDADGAMGSRTDDRLIAQMKAVQAKVGVGQDGMNGPGTKAAIEAWQRSHGLTADGVAGPATLAKMGVQHDRTCGAKVSGDIYADSSNVPCFSGTRDLGVHTGYAHGEAVKIRLCAIPGLKSTSEESTPGSAYYVQGADHDAIVNSRVSGAFMGIERTAANSGVAIAANSSFRTMGHQQALCNANAGCRNGDYSMVAKPGTSNHQLGVAIDFNTNHNKGGQTCSAKATSSDGVYQFLDRNARHFGIKQYSAEAWHWDAMTSSNRC